MLQPWPLSAWPEVDTRYLLCRHDRLFPAEWTRDMVRDRLGITPDEMESGHTPALSHPVELGDRLEAYAAEPASARSVPVGAEAVAVFAHVSGSR